VLVHPHPGVRKNRQNEESQNQGHPPKTAGNPKGRPRNVSSLTVLLREKIAQICEYDKQQRTWQEMIVLATLRLAIEGNSSALREVWDRVDGKVTQLILEEEASYPAKLRVEFVESPIKNPAALSADRSTTPSYTVPIT
jgi:Family of unknown function (DUF5681)